MRKEIRARIDKATKVPGMRLSALRLRQMTTV